MKKHAFAGAFWLSIILCLSAAQAQSNYHLIKKIPVGGEGGWDYLTFDSQARRLYISHTNRVDIVDVESGKIVGEVPNTKGVHGIALAPEFNRGFTSNGRDSTATIFDLKTLQSVSQVNTGKNPDAIIYDPKSKRVFTFNGGSRDATAIDAQSGKIVGTIALNGRPEFAVADGKGMVYVNLEDKSAVVAFDANSLTVKSTWSLAPGEEPTGIAMDKDARRLFVGCANQKLIVMNADNGRVVATLPIGRGVDAVAFDPHLKLAFTSNGEGTLTVVREDAPDKFSVVENAKTQRGARTLALDEKTHDVYLATAEFGAPPAPTPERPRPRPTIVPGSFVILVMGTK
jgi:DNA-binding beta-propeller fold protein YncE